MADLVNEGSPPAVDEPLQPLARPRPEPNVPRHRFGVAYLILATILGVAVGLFVVLTADGGKHSAPAWSSWQPHQEGVRKLDEISRFVAGRYALPTGQRLVTILSTPLEVQDQGQAVPIRAIGVSSGLPGETSRDATFYNANSAWAYNLCGPATKCALPGQPSQKRFNLLRREALELALYTFKYEGRIESIVAYLPPAVEKKSNTTTDTAIFLRRQDVLPALKVPLSHTFSEPSGTIRPGSLTAQDNDSMKHYIGNRIYRYSFQPLQDGTPILVLAPIQR